jgi:hypothetical protein
MNYAPSLKVSLSQKQSFFWFSSILQLQRNKPLEKEKGDKHDTWRSTNGNPIIKYVKFSQRDGKSTVCWRLANFYLLWTWPGLYGTNFLCALSMLRPRSCSAFFLEGEGCSNSSKINRSSIDGASTVGLIIFLSQQNMGIHAPACNCPSLSVKGLNL